MIRVTLREHRAFAIIGAAFLALAISYGITTPLFETPDEREHFAFVQHVARGQGLPVQSLDRAAHLAKQEGSQPPLYYLVAAALTFWIDASDFPVLAWENPHYGYNIPGVVNDNKNLFIHTARENFPYTGAALAIHVARGLSALCGAFAVLFTYLLALEIFSAGVIASGAKQSPSYKEIASSQKTLLAMTSERRILAASAAAFAGFIPQFLFISGAVSNDSAIAAFSALALWRLTRALRVPPDAREIFWLGIICGLAALTKVSGAGLAVLAALLLLYLGFRSGRAEIARRAFHFLLFAVSVGLVAGWWYARNYFLYGELTGTEMMLKIFGARLEPMTAELLSAQIHELRETFLLGFGWGNIRAHPIIFYAWETLGAVATMGVVLAFLRQREPRARILLLLAWALIMVAALLRWMFATQAPHGRLFFPVLPVIGVLFPLGWMQFAPARFQSRVALAAGATMCAFGVFALRAILAPAYAIPAWLNENDAQKIPNRVEIHYADKMKLLGYEISPRRAARIAHGNALLAIARADGRGLHDWLESRGSQSTRARVAQQLSRQRVVADAVVATRTNVAR